MKVRTEPVVRHEDRRGALIKAWPDAVTGEVYVVELRPGSSRGHHYHRRGGEWFAPLEGVALLVVVDPNTGDRAEILLDGLRARVDPGFAHALFATGEPALVLAVADLRPEDDETVPSPIQLLCQQEDACLTTASPHPAWPGRAAHLLHPGEGEGIGASPSPGGRRCPEGADEGEGQSASQDRSDRRRMP